jgi:hypothetical protein
MAHEQEYPTEDQYPTIASTENFEIWDDVDDGVYIISFNVNGVTIAIEHELFEEFAKIVAETDRFNRSQSNGGL